MTEYSEIHDVLLDGIAVLLSRNPSAWDLDQLVSGYLIAVTQLMSVGVITLNEWKDLHKTLFEMAFGMVPEYPTQEYDA